MGHAGSPTRYGRIRPPDEAWLAKAPPESILEPALPIIDTHHHLWERGGHRYLLHELLADLDTGHNVVATVFLECHAMYRAGGPVEMRRGIWETTGLYTEPGAAGWLSITCDSPTIAAWMCAAIILENVGARVDDDRLLLPAGPDYQLKDEVKSIITVVAKTHHYWQAHVADTGRIAPDVAPS